MSKPNILIVMTDQQRADTTLPEHPAVTPNLSEFARQGLAFTQTYCPTAHCCPSRATFFTGLYPSRHGIWNNVRNEQALRRGLKPEVRLWSEDLAAAGYHLHFTGKWHVSAEESPEDRGWSQYFTSADTGAYHGRTWEQYRQLAEKAPSERGAGEIARPGYGPFLLYGSRGGVGDPHDEKVTQDALKALSTVSNSAEPWCLYAGLFGPHDPYLVPRKYLDLYNLDQIPLPASYPDAMEDKPGIYRRIRQMRFGQFSEWELRQAVLHYWAYCSYMDDLFGQILAGLEKTGQAENTLVLYCSDHGDYGGDHGLFCKGVAAFRPAYHIPAIIRWPAGLKNPGRREAALVSLADFGPTFLDVAELQADRHFSGASLLPFLQDEAPSAWREEICTQFNGVELYYTQRAVMTNRYKYVFNGFDLDELYDLQSDPDELVNLANDPTYEDIKRDLCGRMWRFAYQEDDTSLLNPSRRLRAAPTRRAAW